MRKVNVFNFITLNGFYKGPAEDISWHIHGSEGSELALEGLGSGATILFGRVTYTMMASYWPTPEAVRDNPGVAEGMNNAEKIVFSRTLKKPLWNNTKLMGGNLVEAVKKLKQDSEKDMVILGSGSITAQLAEYGLIDEYQFMVDPVALGDGTPIFKGISNKLDLKLKKTQAFRNGAVLLTYQAAKKS